MPCIIHFEGTRFNTCLGHYSFFKLIINSKKAKRESVKREAWSVKRELSISLSVKKAWKWRNNCLSPIHLSVSSMMPFIVFLLLSNQYRNPERWFEPGTLGILSTWMWDSALDHSATTAGTPNAYWIQKSVSGEYLNTVEMAGGWHKFLSKKLV